MKKQLNEVFFDFFSKTWRSVTVIVGFFFLFLLIRIFYFAVDVDNSSKDYINSHYNVFSLRIPKDLNFAGEIVPIDDYTVAESIDRELVINTYWHSNTLLVFKRANRWFPLIESILKKHGIPEDFKYLALVESGLTNSISPAGATGYWQLLKNTAANYNLEVDEEIDERYSMERSTEAACRYFLEAYSRFKNWTLVAASYNLGIGGIENQLHKQKVNSYYELYLNEETSRYVFRILAVKDIFTRPQAYGFVLRKKDLYSQIPTTKLKVDSSITDLSSFAIDQGTNYKTLKLLNPWLLKDYLKNPDGKTYQLEVPRKGIDFTKWESTLLADSYAIIHKVSVQPDSIQKLQ